MPDNQQSDQKILDEAKELFRQVEEAEHDIRVAALDDLRFLNGEQWDETVLKERERNGRPVHVINRLPQFVRQTTNPQRSNPISSRVLPVDDKADIETAEILQGIIRHIEVQSHAKLAYDTASFYAAAMGWGYWHITTEFSNPMSFDQDIKIKRIRNPFSVYLDGSTQEPDGSDAEFGFIAEQFTRKEFEEAYPKADFKGLDDFRSIGDSDAGWITDQGIRIVQFYYRKYRKKTLLLVESPQGPLPILKSELDDIEKALNKKLTVIKERETEFPYIKSCKLNAVEVLQQDEWPGLWIPIVKVIGDEIEIDGELHLHGIVRFAKEPQRQLNWMASAETEAIALEPKAPLLVADGQLEGHKQEWSEANVKNFAYLTYRPVSVAGQPVPPPFRAQANPNILAIVNARREAADDLKATTGIFDAQLGARAGETSGKAILARTQQGETANLHFSDNRLRSIEHSTRILVDVIPKFIDTARMVRITGEDEEQKVVRVNQRFEEKGKSKLFQLGAGKYDVISTAGPSFGSKRQEVAAQMIELTRAYPQLMQIAGDILAENLDMPKAQELAKRLRKLLPPELQDDKQPIPPQVQAQLEQAKKMLEALSKELEKRTEEVQELQTRQGIEMAKLNVQKEMQQQRLDSQEAIALLKTEVDAIKSQLQIDVQEKARESAQTAKQI
jgi:hypothetical protein